MRQSGINLPHEVRHGILVLAAVGFCLLMPAQTSGRTLLEQEWSSYNDWSLAWFKLEGAPEDLDQELKNGLALAGKGRLLRRREMPDFNTRLLRADLTRIRLFLALEGYPAAQVEPVAYPEPGKQRLGLTLVIEPGPMVQVASVDLQGWPEGLALPDSTAKELFLQGDRFRDAQLESARIYLRRFLRDKGYALAEVEAKVKPQTASAVIVVFAVTPGDRYDITKVTVSGCSPDLESLTRRLVDINPPLQYSATRLDEAALDLRSTQLFSLVAFDLNPEGPGQLHLAARVENARMNSVETSVGTWSDNPWMVRAGWTRRNLLGGGKGLDAHAALATHTQKVGGGLTWLGWLSPSSRTRAGAEWVRDDEDSYLSREWRLDLTQSLQPRRGDMAHVGVSFSRVLLTTYSVGDQLKVDNEGNLLEIWADRKWVWTDDPLYPHQGGFGKLIATVSPPIGLSESPYFSTQGDFSLYHSLGGGAVLAGRGRVGWAKPLGDAQVLIPTRRFYAGGYNTMRGYGRRKLGPRDADGVILGGNAVLLGGVEVRMPAVWILELGVFLESGQVWSSLSTARLDQMETAAGACLDFRSPLGPVRFGYAWNLGPGYSGEPESLAHFGVGYPW